MKNLTGVQKLLLGTLGIIAACVMCGICGVVWSSVSDRKFEEIVIELPTSTVVIEATIPPPEATEPPAPTETPVPTEPPASPTPMPEPIYQEPVVLLEYSTAGEDVSDNFMLPVCQKAIFNYSVQSGAGGYASLILRLNNVAEGTEMGLVNDMVEAPQMVGQVLQPLLGGEYYFTSENTDESWQVRVECHDNTAPIAEGMDISGDTPAVTQNYRLSDCRKSVFIWETQPGDGGYASMIVRLVQIYPKLRGETLVNDMQEGDLTGESLEAIETGDYFLVIENISGPWHIRWECRD